MSERKMIEDGSRCTKNDQEGAFTMIVMYVIKSSNVPSRLSPHWLCSNSYTWAYDVRLHIVFVQASRKIKLLQEQSTKWKMGRYSLCLAECLRILNNECNNFFIMLAYTYVTPKMYRVYIWQKVTSIVCLFHFFLYTRPFTILLIHSNASRCNPRNC